MVMVTVPMVSPLFGAWLDSYAGWRSIFAAMAFLGFVSLGVSLWRLSETAPFSAPPGSIASTFKAIPLLIGNREFQGHAIALTATSASFFAFIAAAPFLVVEIMKQSPQNYGLWFMVNALGYMIGNYFTGRFSQKLGSARLTMIGLRISCVGLTLGAVAPFTPLWSPATFFLPLMLSAVGNGLTIPSSTAGGLSVQPELAGAAAGLIGAIQLGLGAIAAMMIGWLVTLWPPALTTAMWLFTGGALLWLSLNSNRRNY